MQSIRNFTFTQKLKQGQQILYLTVLEARNFDTPCSLNRLAVPVNTAFARRYRSGIWVDRSNSTVKDIDHDVEVVGWGEEDGVKYWHVRNSWGTFWGELGFFKLERSTDALFIENGDCWSVFALGPELCFLATFYQKRV